MKKPQDRLRAADATLDKLVAEINCSPR